MTRPLRILVADDERDTREYLVEILTRLGHDAASAASGRQLAELAHHTEPDLVITDIKMPELDGIDAAGVLNREREVPVILVSAYHGPELLERAGAAQVMGYLIKPVGPAEVEAAVTVAMARFEQYRQVRREAADLKQALEDRKQIERAKGTLMLRLAVDEEEAFRRLRRLASDGNLKLAEAARRVLAADEIFRQMDSPEPHHG
jgi:response regulator NasT